MFRVARRGSAVLISCFLLVGVASASRSSGLPGQLAQLSGAQACLAEGDNGAGCTDATALAGLSAVAVSADGRNVYTAGYASMAVSVLTRAAGGALVQQGCSSSAYVDCSFAAALSGASSVAVSPDGRSVYVAAALDSSVVSFSRDASGTLTPLACLSEDGSDGACGQAIGLGGATSVAVSTDGKSVYVAGDFGVAIFQRAADGALTQLPGTAGCVAAAPQETDEEGPSPDNCTAGAGFDSPSRVLVSPDGKNVYVLGGSSIAAFSRGAAGALAQLPGTQGCVSNDGSNGACTTLASVADLLGGAVSPDGKDLYVADFFGDEILVLVRGGTGALTPRPGPAGCLSPTGSGGQCAQARALDGPSALTVSPDGKSVYVTAALANAVLVFARDENGVLRQLPAAAGCISDGGGGGACTSGVSLIAPQSLAISPEGNSLYVTTGQAAVYDSVDVFSRIVPGFVLRVKLVGTGRVTSRPGGITCPKKCSASFRFGTIVTLRPVAPHGWRFKGWTSGCAGIRLCALKVDANLAPIAVFVKLNAAKGK